MTGQRCAECGAELSDVEACVELFHELLALESQVHGAPGGVPHFLAVATYNLQHPSTFAPEALVGLRRAVADVLEGRATMADVRRRAAAGARGATRVKRDGRPMDASMRQWPTRWLRTVRDVCRLAPGLYVEHVTGWARDTIRTLDETLGSTGEASE